MILMTDTADKRDISKEKIRADQERKESFLSEISNTRILFTIKTKKEKIKGMNRKYLSAICSSPQGRLKKRGMFFGRICNFIQRKTALKIITNKFLKDKTSLWFL